MSKRLAAILSPLLATAAIVAACSTANVSATSPGSQSDAGGNGQGDGAAPPACAPGVSVPCVCAGGGYGTATCSAAGTSFSLCAGCPDSDAATSDATVPPGDGAPPSDSGPPISDGSSADGGSAIDSGPPANLVFAHAAPAVPPIRLCLAVSSAGSLAVAPIPAIPDAPSSAPAVPAFGSYPAVAAGTPGIYPGTLGALPSISDFSGLDVTFLAVLSSSIAADVDFDGGAGVGPDGGVEESCVALIGSHGLGTGETAVGSTKGRLTPGVDFFVLSTIPAGTLLDSNAYLLSLTGCLPGAPGSGAATCGAGDGGANAQIGVAELDSTPVAAGSFGAQFAHRSSAIEGTPSSHAAASRGVVPVFITTGPDAGTTLVPLQTSEPAITFSSTGIAPASAGTYALDPTSPDTLFGVILVPPDGGAPSYQPYPTGDLFALPLADIALLSDWQASTAAAPASFANGSAYTFLLVGDPAAPSLAITPDDGGTATLNPAYDGRGLHFVAFPNRFTPKRL